MFDQFSWHLTVSLATAAGLASSPAAPPQPAPYVAAPVLATTPLRPASAPDSCIDVTGGVGEDGAPFEIYPCHYGANQQLAFDGTRVEVLGKCLDAEGGVLAPGTRLILWPCHDGANQQWQRIGAELRVANTDLCAEAPSPRRSGRRARHRESFDPGLYLAPCSGEPDQQWLAP